MSRNKREGWYCGYWSFVVDADLYGYRRFNGAKHKRASRVYAIAKLPRVTVNAPMKKQRW